MAGSALSDEFWEGMSDERSGFERKKQEYIHEVIHDVFTTAFLCDLLPSGK